MCPTCILVTPRLMLRPPRRDDAGAVFDAYAADPKVTRYLGWRPHASVGETERFLSQCATTRARAQRLPWLVCGRHDGAVLGMVDLHLRGSVAGLGYVVAREAWGRGVASEAVRAALAGVLAPGRVNQVWAQCAVANGASARVLEKQGFAPQAGVAWRSFPNLEGARLAVNSYCLATGRRCLR